MAFLLLAASLSVVSAPLPLPDPSVKSEIHVLLHTPLSAIECGVLLVNLFTHGLSPVGPGQQKVEVSMDGPGGGIFKRDEPSITPGAPSANDIPPSASAPRGLGGSRE